MPATVYQPDVVFRAGRAEPNGSLCVDERGMVVATPPAGAVVQRLPGKALLPGLVNAHSHGFQRVIRGRTEYVAQGRADDDFWSWREAMYLAATSLSPEEVELASRQAFIEMALSGITAVGEFHYLHHQADGTPYADVHELAKRVVKAARDVGLRIALLRVAYARAGYQVAPNPRQRRFIEPDVDTYLARSAELKAQLEKDSLVTVGLAPHSVRAVPRSWLTRIAQARWAGPIHLHVSEQPAENKACQAEHGRTPVQLIDETGLLGANTVAVHGIHLSADDIARLSGSGAQVCACPTTEANLGDGVVPADALLGAKVPMSLGSDSQARIDLLEEARLLEGHLRLLRQRRSVLDDGQGRATGLGERLFRIASQGGAQALGLKVGTLAVGEAADFFTVDMHHPSLAGVPLEALPFAATSAVVKDVAVQGALIVRDGQHPLCAPTAERFGQLVTALGAAERKPAPSP